MAADNVLRLENTLVRAMTRSHLLVSAWLVNPDDASRYGNDICQFMKAPPFFYHPDMPPIPVRIDRATLTFARSRQISYEWELYLDEASGKQRPRITHLNIDMSTGDETRVSGLSWLDFLGRYTSQSRYYTFADEEARITELSDDDDDEEEETKPRRKK
jgi:hypothetical protein